MRWHKGGELLFVPYSLWGLCWTDHAQLPGLRGGCTAREPKKPSPDKHHAGFYTGFDSGCASRISLGGMGLLALDLRVIGVGGLLSLLWLGRIPPIATGAESVTIGRQYMQMFGLWKRQEVRWVFAMQFFM